MFNILKFAFLFILPFVFANCSPSVTVSTRFDEETDFSAYKTYKWNEKYIPGDRLALRPTISQSTKSSIDNVLRSKGFATADTGKADFIVAVHARVTDITHIDQYASSGWYQPGWQAVGSSNISTSTEGKLTIDIIDTATEEITWRGVSDVILRDTLNDSQLQEEINKFVIEILKGFPPANKKSKN
jgi:hypothetical protein